MTERSSSSWLKISSVLFLLVLSTATATAFEGGTGTSSDPYEISTCQQLQDMNQDLNAHYELVNDIDCSGFDYNSVGDWDNRFTGVLNGQNHAVNNLTINEGSSAYVGLIGTLGSGGEVRDIGVVDADINGGDYNVGILVGRIYKGSVSSSFSSGSVSGTENVGGLIGYSYDASVSSSFSSGSVSGSSNGVGGLVGYVGSGSVSSSFSSGSVSGDNNVGGLIGDNSGSVSSSFSSGSVSGGKRVGGMVGYNGGSVSSSFWDTETSGQTTGIGDGSGDVTGLTTSQMQGLEAAKNMDFNWENNWRTTENSYPELVQNNGFAGGSGTESDPYEISTCERLQDMENDLDVHYELVSDVDCKETEYWNNGKGFDSIGDYTDDNLFRGSLNGSGRVIDNLYIDRTAYYMALFNSLSASGKVARLGLDSANINGGRISNAALVARNYGNISQSYSTGRVTSDRYGELSDSATVYGTGGLVGYNYGKIEDSYSHANVSGENYVGGLVALNSDNSERGYIISSYSTGEVVSRTGSSSAGGLIGEVDNNSYESYVSESYWGIQSSGQSEGIGDSMHGSYNMSVGTVGLSTSEMQGSSAESNMPGLSFESNWSVVEGDYPVLQWQLSSGDDSSGGDDGGGLPGISICDSRGVFGQCISNSSHSVGGKSFSLSSRFVAEDSAVFEALDSMATISVDNSTSISGLWRGSFSISTGKERTRIKAGAKFRPEGGEIVIGG